MVFTQRLTPVALEMWSTVSLKFFLSFLGCERVGVCYCDNRAKVMLNISSNPEKEMIFKLNAKLLWGGVENTTVSLRQNSFPNIALGMIGSKSKQGPVLLLEERIKETSRPSVRFVRYPIWCCYSVPLCLSKTAPTQLALRQCHQLWAHSLVIHGEHTTNAIPMSSNLVTHCYTHKISHPLYLVEAEESAHW